MNVLRGRSKKLIYFGSLVIAVCMAVLILGHSVSHADGDEQGNSEWINDYAYYFDDNDKTITLEEYRGTDKESNSLSYEEHHGVCAANRPVLYGNATGTARMAFAVASCHQYGADMRLCWAHPLS